MSVDAVLLVIDGLGVTNPGLLALLDLLVKSFLILLLCFCIVALLRTHSPSSRSTVWIVGMSSLLFLPLLQSQVPQLQLAFALTSGLLADSATTEWLGRLAGNLELLLLAYFAIASLLLAYFLLGLWQVLRIAHRSQPIEDSRLTHLLKRLKHSNGVSADVALLVSDELHSPITLGIFRHKIIFPVTALSWKEELQQQALSHELGHIFRNDWLQQLAVRIVQCLYWLNPLVWVASERFHLSSEMACDDIAVDDAGSNLDYAENLLWLATASSKQILHGRALLSGESVLSRRIHYILDDTANHATIDRNGCIPGFAVALTVSALIASFSVTVIEEEIASVPVVTIPVQYFSNSSLESQLFASELEQHKFERK